MVHRNCLDITRITKFILSEDKSAIAFQQHILFPAVGGGEVDSSVKLAGAEIVEWYPLYGGTPDSCMGTFFSSFRKRGTLVARAL